MYKCTECGIEYEIKPAYCECGNDEFAEIQVEKIQKKEDNHPQVSVKPKKIKRPKKTFYEQYPQIEKFVESLDILSVIFFIVCLIIAILIWIFAWNFEPKQTQEEKQTTKPIVTNIPLIDSIWDNTPPSKKVQTENDEVFIPVPKVETVPKRTQTPRPIANTVNKIIKNTPKTTTTNKKQNVIKNEAKKVKNNIQKPKQETKTQQVVKTVQKTETKNITAPTPKTQPKQQTKTTSNNRELQNYKAALRQTLFSRLQIGAIEGNGECIISFSVSSSGKLLNRSFVRQSTNTSLNNAIYRMLMNTANYYAPPSTYKGETFVLKFSYNDGYYEFSYQ